MAGDGTRGYKGDGGPAKSSRLNGPFDVAADASGNIYIADTNNHRIRLMTKSTGIITTVAGDGTVGYFGDGGPATSAGLYFPFGLALDASGNIYIADYWNNRIRLVTKSTGIITTVAGDGTKSYQGDGELATVTGLNDPTHIAVDESGNIYITDRSTYRIRMVTKSDGIIDTVAGNGVRGQSGYGGLAISASLFNPAGIAIDASGNIYIADSYRILMVTKSTGIITAVAGDGTEGYKGDGGPATSASFFNTYGLALDASGNIFIADKGNERIRMVTKSTGIITTVAGGGLKTTPDLGDGGDATLAYVNYPRGIALDASGNIYIASTGYNRIRMVNRTGYATPAPPTRLPTTPPPTAPTPPTVTYPTPRPTRRPTSPPSLALPSSLPSGKTPSSQRRRAVTAK